MLKVGVSVFFFFFFPSPPSLLLLLPSPISPLRFTNTQPHWNYSRAKESTKCIRSWNLTRTSLGNNQQKLLNSFYPSSLSKFRSLQVGIILQYITPQVSCLPDELVSVFSIAPLWGRYPHRVRFNTQPQKPACVKLKLCDNMIHSNLFIYTQHITNVDLNFWLCSQLNWGGSKGTEQSQHSREKEIGVWEKTLPSLLFCQFYFVGGVWAM